MKKQRYTLEAGRTIKKDGCPFAYIGNNGGNPTELDKFARDVVKMMNLADNISKGEESLKNYLDDELIKLNKKLGENEER